MKRMILLTLLLCLLCGCGGGKKQPEPAVLTDTVPATENAEEDGLISLEPPVETDPSGTLTMVPGEASYSLIEHDDSIRNDNGDVLVSIRYQRVVLDAQQPQWQTVNDQLLASYHAFLEETAYLKETSPQEWEEQLQSMGILYGNLMANFSAQVTHNSGGIFSIRMTRDWFMGGVFNHDQYGLNFDLATGEALALARLSDLPEAEFEAQLKTIVCKALEEDREFLFDDPAVILQEFALEDFSYCIDEGELVLMFSTYTFGPGVMGSTEIRTGLYPVL